MKQITLNIPDSKYELFKELLTQLKIEEDQSEYVIPESHKQEVLRRMEDSKPEEYSTWDEVKARLKSQ